MQARETEFVFIASAGQLERLPQVLRSLAAGVRARPLRVVQDQYLDTPIRLLMRCGAACRLRRVGGRDTLTLKSLTPFDDGLADRVELTEELPRGDWTWPGPLPGRDLRARLLPLARRIDVRVLFELTQERRVYDVRTRDGARLEVSADRTALVGTDLGDGLRRIEVELRDGSRESLFRFAAKLRRQLRLKPAGESKFEFGFKASGLKAPSLAEGQALRIRPRDSARQAAARALTRHFRRMLWQVPGTRLGLHPECLHDMRVSVRRLRAILRLFRRALPLCATARVAEELKWLGQSLGAVRDWDVHLQQCATMRRMPESLREPARLCRRDMHGRREQTYEAMLRDLRSSRFGALEKACRDLIRRLRRPAAAGSGEIVMEGALLMQSELKRILKIGRAIDDDTPDAALHRLRVRCKRLRYACEILGDLYGKPVARMARRLAVLQDALGALQDAVAAQTLIARTLAESAAGAPDRTDVTPALECCAARWREAQRLRRAAYPKAWKAFDREKARRSFLKAIRRQKRG